MTPSTELLCPDVGGALSLGGLDLLEHCSFVSNSASSRGLAVAVVATANTTLLSFDGNELNCEAGSYRGETEEVRR